MGDSQDLFVPLTFHSPLPVRFCFPHNYNPHPVAFAAAAQLMKKLIELGNGTENFGEETFSKGRKTGKMFGVLVVTDNTGQLGFISGFSGKLLGKTNYPGFVPPIYDRYEQNGFFENDEQKINALNKEIEEVDNNLFFKKLKDRLKHLKKYNTFVLEAYKQGIKESKLNRKIRREAVHTLSDAQRMEVIKQLNSESANEQYDLKELRRSIRSEESLIETNIQEIENRIALLKEERSKRSSRLQQKLFEKYTFLNGLGNSQNLLTLFSLSDKDLPPSGAGECAAPKLLQFALKNGLTPITMAEFWWGASPANEVRIHRNYYAACRGKCEPILRHMLNGLDCDPDPLEEKLTTQKEISISYRDEDIVVINKPHDLLSVPGKGTYDSVLHQLRRSFPNATGPMIVHRLDMSTSGLMVIALNESAYKNLQRQFEERSVRKRYVAIIQGIPKHNSGKISLPLRVDLDNRPHQVVCHDHGKHALTEYEVIECYSDQSCRVHFYPKSGRTHQLRVHSAHNEGLGCPIKGDELYGKPSDRLYLHAEKLEIIHPRTRNTIKFEDLAPF